MRYLLPFKRLAVVNLICNILSAVFSLFSVVMVIPLLQLVFNQVPDTLQKPAFSLNANVILDNIKFLISEEKRLHGSGAALMDVCVAIVVIIFLKNFFRYMAARTLSPIRTGVMRQIRADLFSKMLSLPMSYFSNERKGDLITRLTDDVNAIERGIISMLEVTVREPLNIVLSLSWMLMISPKLTLFVFAMLGVIGLVIGRIGKSLKRSSGGLQGTVGNVISIIEETLSGMRIIKAFGAEGHRRQQFETFNADLYNRGNSINQRYELASPLTEFLAIAVFSAALWFGGNMVLRQEIEAAVFFGFVALFSLLIQPAKSFSSAFSNVRIGMASADRVLEVLRAENTIVEKPEAIAIPSFQKCVRFENVSFSYGRSRDVLKNISFEVPKGKTIALVGPSGAGKTTLVDLLPRFYDISAGAITIDGIDIRELQLTSLRNLFGVVSQEPVLFNESVYENIAFGNPVATIQKAQAAAKTAQAWNFIQQLEHGMQQSVGERGHKLSGGERQRITIARALLKDPPILILDEATSSLDAESEQLVQQALTELMQGRTCLVIAHRLATIQKADEILVLQEGEIVERGNHADLMARMGLYRKLVDLQTFES